VATHRVRGTYGTNGFHLPFSDNSTAAALGTDTSGNGNDWTVNNLSVQAGNGSYVSEVSGTPYGANYSIVNMFDGSTTTYLAATGTSTTWTPTGGLSFTKLRVRIYQSSGTGQMTFNWSGGSYVLSFTNAIANYTWIDVTSNVTSPVTSVQWSTPNIAGPYVVGWEVDDVQLIDYRLGTGNDSLVDSPTNYGTDSGAGAGGEVRGNYATLNPLATGDNITLSNGNLKSSEATVAGHNFGQRPFAYTAPSGFKALCTTNLPEPTIADGSTAMDVALYTGNGSTQTISGLNFSPDFVWIKNRVRYGSHCFDRYS
jgi:hypothetical protein